MTFDVAVVGFGPTGAMTALRCAQRGLSVAAIDARIELFPHPRAIGLDDEGSRLFHTAGLGDELAQCSTPLRGAEFVDVDRNRVVGFDLPEGFVGPLGHPPTVMFEQPELETALRQAASAAGVDVRLGVAATELHVDEGGVQLVTNADEIEARWLVGADGASSWTRKQLGVSLEDQGYDQPWLVIDSTLLDPELSLPAIVQQVCDPARITTYVIGHGTRRRWEFRLSADETPAAMLEPDMVAELLAPWGTPAQLRIDRTAVYRFHALIADRFRVGPVFLAGDAAHQMPPFNGQGMCSGLRDADNLAWKFELVARGLADEALLDTYEQERRPHAVDTVDHTCDAGRLIDAIAAGADVSTESGYGGGRGRPRIRTGVVDASHSAAGHPIPQPIIDGARLDHLLGTGFAVVSESPVDLPSELAVLGASTVEVPPDALPLTDAGRAVVVRPDRIVASVTDDILATSRGLFPWVRSTGG